MSRDRRDQRARGKLSAATPYAISDQPGHSSPRPCNYKPFPNTAVRLCFPSIDRLRPFSTGCLDDGIKALNDRFPSISSTFGLELRVHYQLERAAVSHTRKVLHRLAAEPILASYWPALVSSEMKLDDAEKLVGMMLGKKAERREKEIWADGPPNLRVFFRIAAECKDWDVDNASIRALSLPAIDEAIVLYAYTIFSHPFRDGNGRFARAMIYSALARRGLISSPCLALAPVFDASRHHLARAALRLSTTGCWEDYGAAVIRVLVKAVAMVGNLGKLEADLANRLVYSSRGASNGGLADVSIP